MPCRHDTAPTGSAFDLVQRSFRSLGAKRADQLEQLAAIRDLRALLDQEEQQAVFSMRLAGETWQDIATASGLHSRQAAQMKFGPATLLDKLDNLT